MAGIAMCFAESPSERVAPTVGQAPDDYDVVEAKEDGYLILCPDPNEGCGWYYCLEPERPGADLHGPYGSDVDAFEGLMGERKAILARLERARH